MNDPLPKRERERQSVQRRCIFMTPHELVNAPFFIGEHWAMGMMSGWTKSPYHKYAKREIFGVLFFIIKKTEAVRSKFSISIIFTLYVLNHAHLHLFYFYFCDVSITVSQG